MSSEWCTIESDPAVFTELLENVGVKGVELEELWTLDDDSLANLGPLYGLIFLFKWTPGQDTSLGERTPLTEDEMPEDLFFAKQVTTNACATQAILSVVLNAQVDLGTALDDFKSFTASFPPDLKGEAIGASADLQQAHNAFARKDAFLHEGDQFEATGNEDIFHFVAYLPFGNKVYELDGLQSGPIAIGELVQGDEKWYSIARNAIQQRMDASPEIKFNLMAVVSDRRTLLEEQLRETGDSSLEEELARQHAKRAQWKSENERRRHNYVPLCVELIKELARKGSLPQLISEAGEKVLAKREKKRKA